MKGFSHRFEGKVRPIIGNPGRSGCDRRAFSSLEEIAPIVAELHS
jgi:hypothetical protein